MGASAVPLALGGLSTIMQFDANSRAQREASRQRQGQQALIDRQVRLYDTLFNRATQAKNAGEFDPDRQIDRLDSDVDLETRRQTANLAGAQRVLGYKAGDSEPLVQGANVAARMGEARNEAAQGLRDRAFDREMAAFQGVNAEQLNPGIQVYGQNANEALSQVQNPAGGLMSMMQFMPGMGFKLPGSGAAPATSYMPGSAGYKNLYSPYRIGVRY